VVQSLFAQNHSDVNSINRFISSQARKNKAVEYEEARKIIYADLNKDEKKDAVVLYTLESFNGNNNYIQYLAIFVKNRSGIIISTKREIIGGHNNRGVYLDSVTNGKINLSTLNYLPTDASCCPSKKGRSQITFSKNKLREVKIN
jgi:hypothetical protein